MHIQQSLLLMVKNPVALEKGTLPSHTFNTKGGSVGAAANSDWYLDNQEGSIQPCAFTIHCLNGDYCLQAESDEIFVNNSHKPLHIGQTVRLKTGDVINLYKYKIRARVSCVEEKSVSYDWTLADILGATETLLLPTGDDFVKNNTAAPAYTPPVCQLLTMENLDADRKAVSKLLTEESGEEVSDEMSDADASVEAHSDSSASDDPADVAPNSHFVASNAVQETAQEDSEVQMPAAALAVEQANTATGATSQANTTDNNAVDTSDPLALLGSPVDQPVNDNVSE